jgi:hypothetical protein
MTPDLSLPIPAATSFAVIYVVTVVAVVGALVTLACAIQWWRGR